MKAYTDINQSKKLVEILPPESADMWYEDRGLMIPRIGRIPKEHTNTEVPCWSLAALLSLLPTHVIYTPNAGYEGYGCLNIETREETFSDYSVDCCVEMIIKNYEQNKERLQTK